MWKLSFSITSTWIPFYHWVLYNVQKFELRATVLKCWGPLAYINQRKQFEAVVHFSSKWGGGGLYLFSWTCNPLQKKMKGGRYSPEAPISPPFLYLWFIQTLRGCGYVVIVYIDALFAHLDRYWLYLCDGYGMSLWSGVLTVYYPGTSLEITKFIFDNHLKCIYCL